MTRAALYWVPKEDDPLFAAGSAWLGRDMRLGVSVTQPPIAGIAEITSDARRYGLHATLRPPMRLATSLEDFRAGVHLAARECTPFKLPALRVCDVGGFLALRENVACARLADLADRCVLGTAAHRAPSDDAELARRRAAGLSARQEALLTAYGYPYVLDEWFFHLTLTRRLSGAEMAEWRPLAEAHFAAVLDGPRLVAAICICVQDTGDFTVAEEISLGGAEPSPLNPPPINRTRPHE